MRANISILTVFFALLVNIRNMPLKAAEISPKQAEALFQSLVRDPQFKAADRELSAVYSKLRVKLDVDAQAQLRDEQRKWLKSRDQLILNEALERRSDAATRLTLIRTRELEGRVRTHATAPQPVKQNGDALESAVVPPSSVGGFLTQKQMDSLFGEVMKDPRVVAADKRMSTAYFTSRSKVDSERQNELRDEQREWLKFRSNHVALAQPEKRIALAVEITKDRENQLLLIIETPLHSKQTNIFPPVNPQVKNSKRQTEFESERKLFLKSLNAYLTRQFKLYSAMHPSLRSEVEGLVQRLESIQGTPSSQYSQHYALVHDLHSLEKVHKAVMDSAKVPQIVLRRAQGEVTVTPPVAMEGINSALFLDSNRLATACGNVLCVWDLQTQKPVWTATFPEAILSLLPTGEKRQFLAVGAGIGQVSELRFYSLPFDGFGFAKCLLTYTQVKAESRIQMFATDRRGKLFLALGYDFQGGVALSDLSLEPVPEKLNWRDPFESGDTTSGKKTTALVFTPETGSVELLISALELPEGDWSPDGPWQSNNPFAAFPDAFQCTVDSLIGRFPNWSESFFKDLGAKPDDVILTSSPTGIHLLERHESVRSGGKSSDPPFLLFNSVASTLSDASWLLGGGCADSINRVSIGDTGWVSGFSVSYEPFASTSPASRVSVNWSNLTVQTNSPLDPGRARAVYSLLGLDSNDDGHSANLPRALALGEGLPPYVSVLKDDQKKTGGTIIETYKLDQGRFKLIGRVPAPDIATTGSSFFCARKGDCVIYVGSHRSFQGLQVWDKSGHVIYTAEVEANGSDVIHAAIELDSDQFALAHSGGLLVLKCDASGRWSHQTFPEFRDHWDLSYNKKAKVLGMTSGNRTVLYDWDGKAFHLKATLLYRGAELPSVLLPNQTYACPRGASRELAFVRGVDVFPFEQFDLRLNRPDAVLSVLGAPREAVTIAKEIYQKRLDRMGIKEEMLLPEFHLPSLEIVGTVPVSTSSNDILIHIKARDIRYPLDRLCVYLNNVPINGREGEPLRDQKIQSLERIIPIHLAAGRNKIQISVVNSAGAESLYVSAEVNCNIQRPKPNLWMVAIGVSEYVDRDWNLKYAAKDAKDIAEHIRSNNAGVYSEIKELVLTDREVTKEILTRIRKFLSKATVDDTVFLFVAGHGLLDEKYDYYFGTSNVDFKSPSGAGIAFEEFEDILAGVACLKKALLIDTCHAGELDEDEKNTLVGARRASDSSLGGQQLAMHRVGARGLSVKPIEGARGKGEWYDRLQDFFVDLRRGSGSTIISSSAGVEYAFESSEQANGLFTHAVLEALDGKAGADLNRDGFVQIGELAVFVKDRVRKLSQAKQTPNVRRVNLESDFAIAAELK